MGSGRAGSAAGASCAVVLDSSVSTGAPFRGARGARNRHAPDHSPPPGVNAPSGSASSRQEVVSTYEVSESFVPIAITGERPGSSQRSNASTWSVGSATQPAVELPCDTCRKIALPRPGVRAVLYAITAP